MIKKIAYVFLFSSFPFLFLILSSKIVHATPVTTIAGWNFEDQNQIADSGIADNLSRTISREGGYAGPYQYFTGDLGSGDYAVSSNIWVGAANTQYWQIEFSSFGYQSLTVSSKQRSSLTGPKNFILSYSIDSGLSWVDISGSSLTLITDNWDTITINNISLPPECDNKDSVYLRWLATVGPSASGGANRIDDIVVSGALVPPVDTDSDGIPDSEDNCPTISNANQADTDGDNVGDVCDNCPEDSNADQMDSDGDGVGDICETTTGICGDGAIDSLEQCDDGDQNGVMCVPGYADNCNYCDTGCQIVTLSGPY